MASPSIESLVIGLQGLRSNPLRTLLSTLGIVIGVASLVAILAVGDGAEEWTRAQIAETTTLQGIVAQPLTVEIVDGVRIRRERVDTLKSGDAGALVALFEGRARVWMETRSSVRVGSTPDATPHVALLSGLVGDPNVENWAMTAGRHLSAQELTQGDRVGTVSPALAASLLGDGEEAGDLLDRSIWVRGKAIRIVGVTGSGQGTEPTVTVPYAVAADLAELPNRPAPPSVILLVDEIEHVDEAEAELRSWLLDRFGDDTGFTILTGGGRVAQAEQAFLVFKLVMGAITGISILVGGIGIMNVLLASVSERTREIGIRKATGARKRDIQFQFLAESVAVSAVGSALGVFVGLAGAYSITTVIRRVSEAPLQAAFTWWTPLVATVVAVLVGIAFGTYPATRAAQLSPIDAIRHE